MFEGLSEESKRLFASPLLSRAVVAVNADLSAANPTDPLSSMTPRPELVFEAARKCPVESVRVVLIAQDPYIKPGEAHGLSFSVPAGVKVPPSLRNIYKCLLHQGMIRSTPATGDLSSWAAQGVLLLNCALTTRIGKSNAHATAWSQYTDGVIRGLSALQRPLIFVLLGGFAQEKKSLIDLRRHFAFEWGHPSNLNRDNTSEDNPKHFKYCTVFKRVNEQLTLQGGLPINWDPTAPPPAMTPLGFHEVSAPSIGTANGPSVVRATAQTVIVSLDRRPTVAELLGVEPCANSVQHASAPISNTGRPVPRECTDQDPQCYTSDVLWIFTDGGCVGNGTSKCTAAYGWYMTDGVRVCEDTGIVEKCDIADAVYQASNNRGELTGILRALQYVIAGHTDGANIADSFSYSSITVVSDSEYSIKSITQWIYAWEKDPEKLSGKKNLDLIRSAKDAVETLKKKCPVNFKHVNSHRKEPVDNDTEEWFLWKCNDIVDKLCNKSLGRK